MNKTSILITGIAMIVFTSCKKASQQKLYYYEIYEIGTRYPSGGAPVDSFSFIDSAQIDYASFQGDTIDRGPDGRFFLTGQFYQNRYQHFEVYRYTK